MVVLSAYQGFPVFCIVNDEEEALVTKTGDGSIDGKACLPLIFLILVRQGKMTLHPTTTFTVSKHWLTLHLLVGTSYVLWK